MAKGDVSFDGTIRPEDEEIKGEVLTIRTCFSKLQEARVKLLDTGVKATGQNKFVGYGYYELSDFLPATHRIFAELGLFGKLDITTPEYAQLEIINTDAPYDRIVFKHKYGKAEIKGAQEIQVIGGETTYLRRYLWSMALELCESDIINQAPPAGSGNQKRPENNGGGKGSDQGGNKSGDVKKPIWITAEQYNKAKQCKTSKELYKITEQFKKDGITMSDGQKNKLTEIYKSLILAEKVAKEAQEKKDKEGNDTQAGTTGQTVKTPENTVIEEPDPPAPEEEYPSGEPEVIDDIYIEELNETDVNHKNMTDQLEELNKLL